MGGRKGGVKDSEAAAWGDRVFVTWNLDKADRWKGGGADARIPELSEKDGDRVIPPPARRQSGPLIAIFSMGARQGFRTRAM